MNTATNTTATTARKATTVRNTYRIQARKVGAGDIIGGDRVVASVVPAGRFTLLTFEDGSTWQPRHSQHVLVQR